MRPAEDRPVPHPIWDSAPLRSRSLTALQARYSESIPTPGLARSITSIHPKEPRTPQKNGSTAIWIPSPVGIMPKRPSTIGRPFSGSVSTNSGVLRPRSSCYRWLVLLRCLKSDLTSAVVEILMLLQIVTALTVSILQLFCQRNDRSSDIFDVAKKNKFLHIMS